MALATPDARQPGRLGVSPVAAVGLGMVLAHAVFRGWAQWGSWFYADDLRLLLQALDRSLSFGYLSEPFDSQFMPVGRFLAWAAAEAGPLSWMTAGGMVLALQVAAALACLRMLLVLFGPRWQVLPLLALWLTSAVPLTSFMWWAAALNAVPMQLAFFLAVAEWVLYLRTRRLSRLGTTLLAVAFGLLAYVKSLLILLVLAWLVLAYFVTGGPVQRTREALRSYWPAATAATVAAVTYVVYYLVEVPAPFEDLGARPWHTLADAMLGQAFAAGVWGGPWLWQSSGSPTALAAPPEVAVRIAWVLTAGVIAYSVLRRRNVGRGWGLLLTYAVALFVLLATSRGQVFGPEIALQYRYLADGMGTVVLALGLVFLPLNGAPGSSTPRPQPRLTAAVPRWTTASLVALAVAGGLVSSVRYVDHWHRDGERRSYLEELTRSLEEVPNAAVVDSTAPESVMPAIQAPYHQISRLVPLTGQEARFPEASHLVHLVTEEGRLVEADVDPRVRSGSGPRAGCGWQVREGSRSVPLGARVMFPGIWWSRIGYLASADSPMTVTFGGTTIETTALQGLNELFVRVPEGVGTVTVGGLDEGVTLCVDRVVTGPLEPARGSS